MARLAEHRRRRGSAGGRPISHNAADYNNRNVIEEFFNRMKNCRAIARRYDQHVTTYRGGIVLAAIIDWLKHI